MKDWTQYETILRRVHAQYDKDEHWSPERTIESAWWSAKARQRAEALVKVIEQQKGQG